MPRQRHSVARIETPRRRTETVNGVSRRNFGVAVLAGLAVCAAVFNLADLTAPGITRLAVGLPLLLAPGCALGTALFPTGRLSRTEWWTVAGGLGLSSMIVTGLVLDTTSVGLDRTSWSVALAGISVVGAVVGVGRDPAYPRGRSAPNSIRPGAVVTGAIVLLAIAAGLGVARQSAATHEHLSHFTELWALPVVRRKHVTSIRVGVKNDEEVDETYRVVGRSGSGKRLFTVSTFHLESGKTHQWTQPLVNTGFRKVIVRLFRGSAANKRPYRSVTIWVAR